MPDQSLVNPLPFLSGLGKSPNTVLNSCGCLYCLQILCLTQIHQGSAELNRNARHCYHCKSRFRAHTNAAVKVGEGINSVDSDIIHKPCFSVTQKCRCLFLQQKFCLFLQTDKAPSCCPAMWARCYHKYPLQKVQSSASLGSYLLPPWSFIISLR